MADNIPAALRKRLRDMSFNASDARDALRGVAVPSALGRRAARLCVVRGIRHHAAFARTPETQALRAWPEFARALNARAIMSDCIPEMTEDGDDVPYCIWHPDTAAEETYRELARRYPSMVYQVARACAVAGYITLYKELREAGSVVPDVAVAEEARACGSKEVYEAVMGEPVKYRVMDDYTRSILKDPLPSGLNGDTAVRPMLDITQELTIPGGYEERVLSGDCDDADDNDDVDDMFDMFADPGFNEATFDITEDLCIDERTTEPPGPVDLSMAAYLAKPLPVDLPIGNKDILIFAAAYSGDVDRYARLRRPRMVKGEAACVARGIYHNPFFATWCAEAMKSEGGFLPGEPQIWASWVARAVHARMIMSNDLSRLTPEVPREHVPYLIWYPAVARSSTYREVARRCPSMRTAVLRAAIYTRDRALFDELVGVVEPDPFLLSEARAHDADDADDEPAPSRERPPSYYTRRLLERADQLGIGEAIRDPNGGGKWGVSEGWKRYGVRPDIACSGTGATGSWLYDAPVVVAAMQDPGIYNEAWADASAAELFASVPEAWRPGKRHGGAVEIDYEEWPPR